MIEYEILKEKNALPKSLTLVSDRLHEHLFTTDNIYVNGKVKTHSGIINKSCQVITDTCCSDSEILLNYDGTINKFIIILNKEIVCKTKILLQLNVNRLRAQIIVINNTNIIQNTEFYKINLNSPVINIKPHDFVILDTVCISNCCTGTFEKQPDIDISKNDKLNYTHLSTDFFSDTLNKIDFGSLQNVQNNQNISNSILLSKNGKFVLNEIDKHIYIYPHDNNVILHLNIYSNVTINIEQYNANYIEQYNANYNISLNNKIRRGFITIINKTLYNINLIFTGSVTIICNSHSTITVGYSPFNNDLSQFTSTNTVINGENITSETVFDGIQEINTDYHTNE